VVPKIGKLKSKFLNVTVAPVHSLNEHYLVNLSSSYTIIYTVYWIRQVFSGPCNYTSLV
jgi:hypothetical protein